MAKIKKKEDVSLLWSDDGHGRNHLPKNKKSVKEDQQFDPKTTTVRMRLEKKGRGGKVVTLIYELPDNQSYFKKLSKELKNKCGSGGSYKDGAIEIQGERLSQVKALLEEKGFKVIVSGGNF